MVKLLYQPHYTKSSSSHLTSLQMTFCPSLLSVSGGLASGLFSHFLHGFFSAKKMVASSSKPLNPLALSFKPQPNQAMDELYLHHQFFTMNHYEDGLVYHHPYSQFPAYFINYYSSFEYFPAYYYPSEAYKVESLNMYIPEKQQPHAMIKVFDNSNLITHDGISCGSRMKVRNKTKGKRVLPPRLKQLHRGLSMHKLVYVPKKPVADSQLHGKTSLMIKNVPNHLRRSELLQMLDQHCLTENRKDRPSSTTSEHAYDFVYLPMDFGFGLNLGFAFVNFTNAEAASKFFKVFNKREWKSTSSSDKTKICEIGIANIQGRDGLQQRFHKSSFPCDSDDYLPVLFNPPRNGSNSSCPVLVGRRTHVSATASKVMIMTQRKNRKA